MRYTFDSTFEDGSPRRFVGTWRPAVEDYVKEKVEAEPWRAVYGVAYVRQQWAAGDGDRALYAVEDDPPSGTGTRRLVFDLTDDDEARIAEISLCGVIDGKIARGEYQEIDG